jgi:YaiO family outer membrane protein
MHPAVRLLAVSVAGVFLCCAFAVPARADAPPAAVGAQDDLARARELATSGRRNDAIALLRDRLSSHPDDPDARTLLGVVLSWEGRYPEARVELRRVLADRPAYYDAVAALVHVELWDDHPAIALSLAEDALGSHPDDSSLMLARARALSALNRTQHAIDELDNLLALDATNQQARQMRQRLVESQRSWSIGAGYGYDGFSDRRTPWQEQWLMLRRRTGIGSVIFTGSRADRYHETDQQYELEAYPRIRPGTYMYLDSAFSPNQVWYPKYRLGAHVYQSFGRGYEGSIGCSRLGFGDGINIYIASLSKYISRWLLIGQVFIRPKDIGTNASYHAAFRYYFSDRQYFGLRYHYGAAKEKVETIDQIQILKSTGVSTDIVFQLGHRLDFRLRGMYDDQERLNLTNLKQYSASAQMYVKF